MISRGTGIGEQNHHANSVVTPRTKITTVELSGQHAELSSDRVLSRPAGGFAFEQEQKWQSIWDQRAEEDQSASDHHLEATQRPRDRLRTRDDPQPCLLEGELSPFFLQSTWVPPVLGPPPATDDPN